MAQGPKDAGEGTTEGIKGGAKKAAGAVTGNREMEKEGKAQQEKADAKREAAGKEAEAEKARGKAEGREGQQRSHQP